MNKIKKRLISFIQGTTLIDDLESTPPFFSQEFLSLGEKNDADAILIGGKEKSLYYLIGLVGKSVLQGPELNAFLINYFKADGGLEAQSEKIADHFYQGFQKAEHPVLVLRCEDDETWRSFKPIKSIEEIMFVD